MVLSSGDGEGVAAATGGDAAVVRRSIHASQAGASQRNPVQAAAGATG